MPDPLIVIMVPFWKLEPFSVTATLVPCVPLLGTIELRAGVGTLKVVTVAFAMA
jgi:hypothetical protein